MLMSTLPLGCGLEAYEVPTDVEGATAIKGILLNDAAEICKACLDIRAQGGQPLCHPILLKNDPSIPPPFLVLVDGQPTVA